MVALLLEVVERLLQQFEVLMVERLRCCLGADGGIGAPRCPLSYLDAAEGQCLVGEPPSVDELMLRLHLLEDGLLFHLGGSLHAFGESLLGEAFFVSAVDDIAHEEEVFRHEDAVGGQELQERHLLRDIRQLRDDVGLLTFLFRQLVLHVEQTDGVNLVVEEVDAERILVAEGKDVNDAAAYGKLTRFVDVVDLVEPQIKQLFLQFGDVAAVAYLQADGAFVHLLLRHNQLGHRLGVGDDDGCILTPSFVSRFLRTVLASCSLLPFPRKHPQHLRPEHFVGSVTLSVLDAPPIA